MVRTRKIWSQNKKKIPFHRPNPTPIHFYRFVYIFTFTCTLSIEIKNDSQNLFWHTTPQIFPSKMKNISPPSKHDNNTNIPSRKTLTFVKKKNLIPRIKRVIGSREKIKSHTGNSSGKRSSFHPPQNNLATIFQGVHLPGSMTLVYEKTAGVLSGGKKREAKMNRRGGGGGGGK